MTLWIARQYTKLSVRQRIVLLTTLILPSLVIQTLLVHFAPVPPFSGRHRQSSVVYDYGNYRSLDYERRHIQNGTSRRPERRTTVGRSDSTAGGSAKSGGDFHCTKDHGQVLQLELQTGCISSPVSGPQS